MGLRGKAPTNKRDFPLCPFKVASVEHDLGIPAPNNGKG